MIDSMPTAVHSVEELGIICNEREASIAPAAKYCGPTGSARSDRRYSQLKVEREIR